MDYQKLEGNPTHAAPFDRLVELAQATAWAHPDYGPIEVTRVGIDTGYQPRHVQRIARAHPTLVFGMRGETGGLGLPFILEQAKDKHGHSARGWHPLRVNHEATQFAFRRPYIFPWASRGRGISRSDWTRACTGS